MKILVTGAFGQVGSELCRKSTLNSEFEIVPCGSLDLDITNKQQVMDRVKTEKPGLIINAAAYTAVDKAESDREQAFLINEEGSKNLAEATKKFGIPIFHISTDYVFDGTSPSPYKELDPVSPLGVYGQSKLAGEQAVAEINGKHIIMRTSWVFGVNGGNFPKTMLRLAQTHPEIRVVNDQIGCPTFARDIADALLSLAHQLQKDGSLPWGLYHYSGAEPCSWYDFACVTLQKASEQKLIEKMPLVSPILTSDYPTPARRPEKSIFDCKKWESNFQNMPLSAWRSGLDCLISELSASSV